MTSRTRPNILVTGTPGTGKTSLCARLAECTGLKHINVGELVRDKSLHEGRDDVYDCFILDEDKVCDELEDEMEGGGIIIDFHSCDFFPERWFDLVLVLRVDNTTLYDRLVARGYNQKKIEDNVTCEIMQVIYDEARESYLSDIVHELQSKTPEDYDNNVARVEEWLQNWYSQQGQCP